MSEPAPAWLDAMDRARILQAMADRRVLSKDGHVELAALVGWLARYSMTQRALARLDVDSLMLHLQLLSADSVEAFVDRIVF